jgi:hypothetical protein
VAPQADEQVLPPIVARTPEEDDSHPEPVQDEEIKELPEEYIAEVLSRARPILSETPEQFALKELFESLSEPLVARFLSLVADKVGLGTPLSKSQQQRLFFQRFYTFLQSPLYKKARSALFELIESPFDMHCLLAHRLATALLHSHFCHMAERKMASVSAPEDPRIAELVPNSTAGARVRYVAGYVVHRLLKQCNAFISCHIFGPKWQTQGVAKLVERAVLCQIAGSADRDTQYPLSKGDILDMEQSRLIHLTDSTYLFFLELEKERLANLSLISLYKVGRFLPAIVADGFAADPHLFSLFEAACVAPASHTGEEGFAEAKWATAVRHMFSKLIFVFMKTAARQFRRDFIRDMQLRKKQAHRRQVQCQQPAPSASSENESSWSDSCAWCGEVFVHGKEDWVECDSCTMWFQRKCTDLSSQHDWQLITEGNQPWSCTYCNSST